MVVEGGYCRYTTRSVFSGFHLRRRFAILPCATDKHLHHADTVQNIDRFLSAHSLTMYSLDSHRDDYERRREILRLMETKRQQLLRLLTIVKWASKHSDPLRRLTVRTRECMQ